MESEAKNVELCDHIDHNDVRLQSYAGLKAMLLNQLCSRIGFASLCDRIEHQLIVNDRFGWNF